MNRYLQPGYNFSLNGIEGVFEIKSVIGYGSSCAVYFAEFTDENGICTEHLIKEYNPQKLDLARDESGVLFVDSDDDLEAFTSGLLRFENGYKKQLGIRKLHETKNTTSNIQGIYEGNGTKYIDMTCFNGITYDKIQETSLYDLLRRIKTIVQTIKHYHDNRFLHLDLKPNNIFTIPESVELVMFFDFDSLLTKDEIISGGSVSYTEAWAAPEILLPGRKSKICEATDLFSIGEMMFYQLFGRHSFADERRSFAKYEYDFDSEICKNVDPKIFPMLSEFFSKTICGVVSKRYVTANEMLDILDQMIPLANPHEPRIVSSLPSLQSFFVGRDSEIEEIHNRLAENDLLFVSGMGGIGKSELVKNYAAQYKDSYDAIIFAPYINDFMMLITDDKTVSVANIEMFQGEQPNEYYDRKLRKLNELCNERTLFIIDNFDTAEDPYLNDILSLGCKKIITTRNNFADYNYPQIEIGSLAMRSDINSIFNKYYNKPLDEESQKTVDLIIDLVDGHTMTVELIAKQMKSGRATPQKTLAALSNGGLVDSGKEKIEVGKDSVLSRQSAYDHIRALFDISELDGNELYILGNLSLIPHSGISTEQFKEWGGLEDYETINTLITEGWIRWDEETDFISLHPVVSDIMFELVKEEKIDFEKLIKSLTGCLDSDEYDTASFEKRTDINDISLFCTERIYRSNIESETVAYLLDSTAIETKSFGHLDLCIAYAEKAKEIREKLFGNESAEAAKSYNSLGKIFRDKGDLMKSEGFYLKALETRKTIYGEDDEKTSTLYNNIANLYKEQGMLDKAETNYLKALNIRENIYGENHSKTATTYNGLGSFYQKLGNLAKAEKFLIKALNIRKDIYGEMHGNTANSYSMLGSLYKELGQLDKAEEFFLKALNIRISIYGEMYSDTATSYSKLGSLCKELGQLDKAEEFYLKALNIRKSIYGEMYSDTAISYNNLGSLYKELGKFDKAEEFYLKALNIRKSIYGEMYSSTAISYNNLGTLYRTQKNFDEAEKCFTNALYISKNIYGDNHLKTSAAYSALGELYRMKNDYQNAEKNLLKALEIRQKLYGENYYRTAMVYHRLAGLYFNHNKLSKAETHAQKAYEIYLNIYSETNSETQEVKKLLDKIKSGINNS